MSIPSMLIAGFIRLASCGYMGARIVHSLWLIEADPHRGGSISLMPKTPSWGSGARELPRGGGPGHLALHEGKSLPGARRLRCELRHCPCAGSDGVWPSLNMTPAPADKGIVVV